MEHGREVGQVDEREQQKRSLGWGDDCNDGDREQVGRCEAQHPPHVEVAVVAGLQSLTEQDAGDEKAGKCEEDVNTQEAEHHEVEHGVEPARRGADGVLRDVVEDDGECGEPAHAVEFGDMPLLARAGGLVKRERWNRHFRDE